MDSRASSQLEINFNKPLCEGLKWQSLTVKGQAMSDTLEYYLYHYNANRRLFGLPDASHADMVRARWGVTVFEWKAKIFTREMYYLSRVPIEITLL